MPLQTDYELRVGAALVSSESMGEYTFLYLRQGERTVGQLWVPRQEFEAAKNPAVQGITLAFRHIPRAAYELDAAEMPPAELRADHTVASILGLDVSAPGGPSMARFIVYGGAKLEFLIPTQFAINLERLLENEADMYSGMQIPVGPRLFYTGVFQPQAKK